MSKLQTLINRTKILKGRVKGELGEVIDNVEKQLQEVSKIIGIEDSSDKDKKILEAAPIGSFEYTREKLSKALSSMEMDPDGDGDRDYPWIYYVFPDRVIITCDDCYYEMTYSIDTDGNVTFGDPIEVEQYFTATESVGFKFKDEEGIMRKKNAKKLKESGIEIIKEAEYMDFESGTVNAHIKEGSFNADTGEVEVVLIEAGTNPLKKRHYPDSTIREAAPNFQGMKMYINHQTDKEERERPERDLRDWVSTIQESYEGKNAVNGRVQALGKVYIHDPWLRERMADPVFLSNVGLSINTGGKISYGKINGEEMQIVEKINPSRANGLGSVDWVTEAGARGRVVRQIKESATNENTEEVMNFKDITIDQLKKENPDLVKKIQESGSSNVGEEQLAEANRKIADLERKGKLAEQKEKINSILQESKLPVVAKNRISEELKETLFDSDEKLKEALGLRIKNELDYINQFSSKGRVSIPSGGGKEIKKNGGDSTIAESQKILEGRFGIKEETKDDDDDK